MSKRPLKRVLVVQPHIKHYRVPFFEKLHVALALEGVKLRVAYSEPAGSEAKKLDNQELPPEYGVKVKGIWACGQKVLYQPVLREAAASDLVIVAQANKYALNHMLLLLSAVGLKKVAFWGHGKNRRSNGYGFFERLKKATLNRADWWFAYTEGTARYLVENSVPASRITNVQNAVDTTEFRQQLASICPEEIVAARDKYGISAKARIGLFCGGITREKSPEFLIDSARRIRQNLSDFELLVLGAGPEQGTIEDAARYEPWIHYLGPKFGREKALYFRLADLFLMPGLVGLAILDAFSAGLPVVTSSVPFHSPEIEYLEDGQNGMMTMVEPQAYSLAIARLLSDAHMLRQLKDGALVSSEKYTLEEMVERFRAGILSCFDQPVREAESRQGYINDSDS